MGTRTRNLGWLQSSTLNTKAMAPLHRWRYWMTKWWGKVKKREPIPWSTDNTGFHPRAGHSCTIRLFSLKEKSVSKYSSWVFLFTFEATETFKFLPPEQHRGQGKCQNKLTQDTALDNRKCHMPSIIFQKTKASNAESRESERETGTWGWRRILQIPYPKYSCPKISL